MENFKFNSSILEEEERTSYLTWDNSRIILDLSKWVHPLLDVNILKKYNEKISKLVLEDYWYEYMDLSNNWKYYEFKETICNKFDEYKIEPDNIILWHWSFHIIERIFTKVLKNWTELLWTWPQFNELPAEFSRIDKNLYTPTFVKGEESPQLDQLYDDIKESTNASAVYLDSPNNPTWKILDENEIINILDISQKKWLLVVIDEAYWDFIQENFSFTKLIDKYEKWLVVRSMWKWYWLSRDRIWYWIANKTLINKLSKVFVPFEPSEKSLLLGNIVMKENPILDSQQIIVRKEKVISILNDKWIEISNTDNSIPILLAKYNDIYFKLLNEGIKTVPWSSYLNTNPFMTNDMSRLVIPKDDDKYNLLLDKLSNLKF